MAASARSGCPMPPRRVVGLAGADRPMDAQTNQHLSKALARIEDGYFDRRGIVRKRRGYDNASPGVDADALGEVVGQPLALGGSGYVWDGSAWVWLGTASPQTLESDYIRPESPHVISDVDSAVIGNVLCLVYTAAIPGGTWEVRVETHDLVTGKLLYSQIVQAANAVKCMARVTSDGSAFIAWVAVSAGTFSYADVTSAGVIGTLTAVGLSTNWDNTRDAFFDAEQFGSNQLLVYSETTFAVTANCYYALMAGGGTISSQAVIESGGALEQCSAVCAVRLSDGQCLAGWAYNETSGNHNVKVRTVSSAAALGTVLTVGVESGATNAINRMTAWRDSDTAAHVIWDILESDGWPIAHQNYCTALLTTPVATFATNATDWVFDAQIAGRPRLADAMVPLAIRSFASPNTTLQASIIFSALTRDGDAYRSDPRGKALIGRSGFLDYSFPNLRNQVPGKWVERLATPAQLYVPTGAGSDGSANAIARLNCVDRIPAILPTPHHSLLDGALPMVVDGDTFVEHGFLMYPETIYTSVAAGATAISAGNYRYLAVYERVDASGRLFRSAPTPVPALQATSAGDTVTVNVRDCKHTRARRGVRARIYRTAVSASTPAPGPFYAIGAVELGVATGVATYVDAAADSSITDNEKVYTYGDEVPTTQPPPSGAHAIWGDKHIVADSERPGFLAYSRDLDDPFAFEHNDYFNFRVSSQHGVPTAMRALSKESLVVFYDRAIFVVSGAGYTPTLYGQNIAGGRLLSTAIGCINHRSVAETPLGLVFQSDEGLYLLTQQGVLRPVGDAVRDFVLDRTVVGVAVLPDYRAVVWHFSDSPSLAWCYDYDRWALWVNSGNRVAAVAIDGVEWILNGSGANTSLLKQITSTPGTVEDVVWQSGQYVTITGNSVSKSGGGGAYNAGAISQQSLSGDGALEWTVVENDRQKFCALTNDNPDYSYGSMDFAIQADSSRGVYIWENGVTVAGPVGGEYSIGDIFRIQVKSGVVTYYRNGVLLWTSVASPTFPLYVDCSLYHDVVGPDGFTSTISDAVLYTGLPAFREDDLVGSYTAALAVETPWMSLSEAIAGFARVHRLYLDGYTIGDCTLKVSVAYDGEPEWREVLTFDATALADFGPETFKNALGTGTTYEDLAMQLEVALGRSKCSKIKVRIEESPASEGDSWALSAISALVTLRPNAQKAFSGRRF